MRVWTTGDSEQTENISFKRSKQPLKCFADLERLKCTGYTSVLRERSVQPDMYNMFVVSCNRFETFS